MSAAIDGGPAFPTSTQLSQNQATGETTTYQYLSDGLSLRDYFAAKALTECIRAANAQTPPSGEPRLSALFDRAAVYAYYAADAMLKARQE